MKEHAEIRSLLLSSIEGTLSAEEQREVEDHVAQCELCKSYFEILSVALLPSESQRRTTLALDPFLPVRVKAVAKQLHEVKRVSLLAALQWTFRAAAFVVAVVLGIYLGEKAANPARVVTGQRVISEYSEMFATEGIDDRLQTVTQTSGEASK